MASRVVDVAEAVEGGVGLHALQRLGREVDRGDLVRLARHLEREAAVVGEGVEHAPAGVLARREVVLALVEEEAGLLPLAEVDAHAHVALGHLDEVRAPRRGGRTPSAPGPRASGRAGRCARRCPWASGGPRAPPRSRPSRDPCPARASGGRGSRRSGPPRATARRRPRRGRRGRPRPRPPPSRASGARARSSRAGSPREASPRARSCAGGSPSGRTRTRSRAASRARPPPAPPPRARPRPPSRCPSGRSTGARARCAPVPCG